MTTSEAICGLTPRLSTPLSPTYTRSTIRVSDPARADIASSARIEILRHASREREHRLERDVPVILPSPDPDRGGKRRAAVYHRNLGTRTCDHRVLGCVFFSQCPHPRCLPPFSPPRPSAD